MVDITLMDEAVDKNHARSTRSTTKLEPMTSIFAKWTLALGRTSPAEPPRCSIEHTQLPDNEEQAAVLVTHSESKRNGTIKSLIFAKLTLALGITSPTETPRVGRRSQTMEPLGSEYIRMPHLENEIATPNAQLSSKKKVTKKLEPIPSIFATWILAMTCTSVILFLLAGLNCVTGFSIFVVAAAGLTSSDESCHPKSRAAYGCMVLFHFSLLFSTMMSKGCAKVAGIELDEKAVKFLFVPTSETKAVFGDSFADAVVGFIFKILAQATILAFVVTGFAVVMAKKATIAKRCLASVLQLCCLLGIGTLASASMSQLLLWKGQCSDARFVGPPPTVMKKKPSMLFISIDSLRQDMFGNSTFPKTRNELMFGRGSHHGCTQWPNHDSEAFQSDQGFTSLYYSMRGPTSVHYAQYKRNKDIQSWPLVTLRDQGYYLHRITAANFKYCWVMLEECDLQFRDFHTCDPSMDELVSGGDDRVFNNAETWIREWTQRNSSSPFLLTLDLQDVRFPYVVKQNAALDIQFYEPSLTQTDVYTLKQDASKMNTAPLHAMRLKLSIE
jgi:hypothetical protein